MQMKTYKEQAQEKADEIRQDHIFQVKEVLRFMIIQFESDLKGFLADIKTVGCECENLFECSDCIRKKGLINDITSALEIINKLREEGII
jgi:hypothetical protein